MADQVFSDRPVALYDGDCRFCRSCVDAIRERTEVRWQALQDWPEGQLGLTNDQLRASLHVVDGARILHGAAAVSAILATSHSPRVRSAARLMDHRRVAPGAELAYRYVASHRGALGLLVRVLKREPVRD